MTKMSVQKKIRRNFKTFRNHDDYLTRITKTLYYVKLPKTERTSLPVSELAAEIFSETKNRLSLDYLDTEEVASLSASACVSPCSLVVALLYLDRLKSSNPKYLAKVSPSQLFLISLMIGSKFLQDDGEEDEVNNDEWAASAGISVQDINRAEKEFLKAIDWEVYVSETSFWQRHHTLEQLVGLRQGKKRGWFTYTDLELVADLIDVSHLIQTLFTVTTVCLTSYTAGVLTIVGSAFIASQAALILPAVHMNNTHLTNNLTSTPINMEALPINTVPYITSWLPQDADCRYNSSIEESIQMPWPWTFVNFRPQYAKLKTIISESNLFDNYLITSIKKELEMIRKPFDSWADIIRDCVTQRSFQSDLLQIVTY